MSQQVCHSYNFALPLYMVSTLIAVLRCSVLIWQYESDEFEEIVIFPV